MKYIKVFALIGLIILFSGCVDSGSDVIYGGSSGNSSSGFNFNLFGYPILTNSTTLHTGVNMTSYQAGTDIFIDAIGSAGGTIYNNYTNNSYYNTSVTGNCNPANEALTGNGSQCINVADDDSIYLTAESDPISMANISANMASWLQDSSYNATYDGTTATVNGNLANWNNTYNASYDSKEPGIIGSSNNVFWNGLKSWIPLQSSNISNFNQTVNGTFDRNLANYSNSNTMFVTNQTMQNDNSKVNKSGDIMSGSLNLTNNSITNVSRIALQGNTTKNLQIIYYQNGTIYFMEI